jgi:hypothetical protein
MKKLLKTLWIGLTIIWWTTMIAQAQFEIWTDAVNWYHVVWTNSSENSSTWDQRLLGTVKKAINRVLWMLSLIALVLCLRWWFQMLTAMWDDWKVKKWTKVLTHAAIWLAVIWLSWIFVTFIFYLINNAATT